MDRRKTGCFKAKKAVVAVLMGALMLVGTPLGVLMAEEAPPSRLEGTLESLSDVLQRLEAELAALEAPKAERLEDGVEEIIELIEGLLAAFNGPGEDLDRAAMARRIVQLDLMLHRLVHVLDEIVDASAESPARPRARGAVDDLRRWVDAYIAGLTAGMDPGIAERIERAVHDMVRDMASRIAELARKAQPSEPERPGLARLVGRLEQLLFQLDRFILKLFPAHP